MSSSNSPNSQESLTSREQAAPVDVLAENAASIRELSKRLIADVIEIGRRLSECKQLLGHGNWLPWIKREFRWSERTARNFTAAFEFARSKSANVAELEIEISSLYLLAAPSTPEEARVEVLRRAEAGEVLPHEEVKRIIGDVRKREIAGPSARSMSARAIIKKYAGDFGKLPSVDRRKILDERPDNIDLAIADATTRQLWKRPYRQLQDALEAVETVARLSTSKIIAAIPVEHFADTAARVDRAKDFLMKLDAKLARGKNVRKTRAVSDSTHLDDLLREARKTCIKKYGRYNQAKILEMIWSELNPAQIVLLRSGQYGPQTKVMAERLMLAKESSSENAPSARR